MILIATVEHTGTMALLESLKWRQRPIEDKTTASIQFCHLHDSMYQYIADWPHEIFTTYRPFQYVVASWLRRDKDLIELYRQWANWEILIAIRQPRVIKLCR